MPIWPAGNANADMPHRLFNNTSRLDFPYVADSYIVPRQVNIIHALSELAHESVFDRTYDPGLCKSVIYRSGDWSENYLIK